MQSNCGDFEGDFIIFNYDIPDGTPLTVDNVSSIIFYTDYSELCKIFSATFRRQSISETNNELKARNSVFWHWSKILRETVELYGDVFWGDVDSMPILYHGVSFLYFDSFVARFCSPTSTTPQISVATIFADDYGIILELERFATNDTSDYAYCFNCSLLSCYGSEDERLFVGGFGPLQFHSIRSVKDNENYLWYIKALTLLDTVTNGNHTPNKFLPRKIICRLLDEKLGIKTCKFPKYIKIMFDKLTSNKKRVIIRSRYLPRDFPILSKLFIAPNGTLLLQNIATIFNQCTNIIHDMLFRNDKRRYEKKHLSFSDFTNFHTFLIANENTKLQTIQLDRCYYKDDKKFEYLLNLFNKANWDIEQTGTGFQIFRIDKNEHDQ